MNDEPTQPEAAAPPAAPICAHCDEPILAGEERMPFNGGQVWMHRNCGLRGVIGSAASLQQAIHDNVEVAETRIIAPPKPPHAGFPYVYRWDLMGRKGQRCRVLVRGRMNSCAVEFEDGFQAVTSRNALRKAQGLPTLFSRPKMQRS